MKKFIVGVASIVLLSASLQLYAKSSLREDIVNSINSGNVDKTISLINDAKELRYQGEMINFMESLWKKNKNSSIKNVKYLDKEIIRINIADFLVQAHTNGLVELDIKEFDNYAKNVLMGKDVQAKSNALFVLGNIGNPKDANLIKSFSESNSDYLFRSSILALAMMCNRESSTAIKEIKNNTKSSTRREFIESVQKQFKNYRRSDRDCVKATK